MMILIVGLGNPGTQYQMTRHNAGFLFMDWFAEKHRQSISQFKFKALTQRFQFQDKYDLILSKPQTYMNLSGDSVRETVQFYKLKPEQIITVFDDLDQPFAAVKNRLGGGHGGHNGIRSMIDCLGSDGFHRIKIGIGRPEHKSQVSSWVLHPFSAEEVTILIETVFPEVEKRLLLLLKQMTKKTS